MRGQAFYLGKEYLQQRFVGRFLPQVSPHGYSWLLGRRKTGAVEGSARRVLTKKKSGRIGLSEARELNHSGRSVTEWYDRSHA